MRHSATPKTVYLSQMGDDDASGFSEDAPWKTLGKLSTLELGPGDTVLLQAGDTWAEPMVLQGSGATGTGMRGYLEGVHPAEGVVAGWVFDTLLPGGGVPPVRVEVFVDSSSVLEVLANMTRSDLPAPNPQHGFTAQLPPLVVAQLKTGFHRVDVRAIGCGKGCGEQGYPLPLWSGAVGSCVCSGVVCPCPPTPMVRVTSWYRHKSTRNRAAIRLNGSGTAVHVGAIGSLDISAVELSQAQSGIVAPHLTGCLSVSDMLFLNIFNDTSIGQSLHRAPSCSTGWTPSVFASASNMSIMNCVFDNVDVAFAPSGTISGSARFLSNTITRGNGNMVNVEASNDWLVSGNVFTRNYAPRFFSCGTTDVIIGGPGTKGNIVHNEFGWRGEHPGAGDGCAIDYESCSDGVTIAFNLIHDSYAAGVMVLGSHGWRLLQMSPR